MHTCRIAVIGGDGIGPEVMAAGVQALSVCAGHDGGFKLDFHDFDWGSNFYQKHGVMMPADGVDQLRAFDAILFGAVGAPDIPDHITLWGLRLAICQGLDQYANIRPTRILPGIISPLRHISGPELDWVIVRENTEGEYSGVGGRVVDARSRLPGDQVGLRRGVLEAQLAGGLLGHRGCGFPVR
jgi:tartrate dehydrogenase/decarboxylase/D-malate dehydrogenase